MSLIPKSKFGDCCQCGLTDTNVVKVKKDTYCLQCHKSNKTKQQMAKQREKVLVRNLIDKQREDGTLDSTKELIIDLDRVTSRYIRLRDMEKDGKITCYICERRIKWEKAQAMHYINRQHLGTRFLLSNLKSGCFDCNVTKRGNLIEYAKKLESETPDIVEWLIEQSHTVSSPTRNELKELLCDFQNKLRMVESKLK